MPAKSLVKPNSRKLIPAKSLVKANSRILIPAKCSKKNSRKLIFAKISSLKVRIIFSNFYSFIQIYPFKKTYFRRDFHFDWSKPIKPTLEAGFVTFDTYSLSSVNANLSKESFKIVYGVNIWIIHRINRSQFLESSDLHRS